MVHAWIQHVGLAARTEMALRASRDDSWFTIPLICRTDQDGKGLDACMYRAPRTCFEAHGWYVFVCRDATALLLMARCYIVLRHCFSAGTKIA
jgi:hypothetical protein